MEEDGGSQQPHHGGSETPLLKAIKNAAAGDGAHVDTQKIQVTDDFSPALAEKYQAPMTEKPGDDPVLFKTYRLRWFIITTAALLNFSNTMSWISYASVANHVDEYYGPYAANWCSMIFLVSAVPVAFVAMWAGGRFGLRTAFYVAATANALGAVIRMLSIFDQQFSIGSRFVIVLCGQGVASIAYPFIMFMPTKVAASWFPDNQRAIANTIGTLANPIGVLVASLMSPAIVDSVHTVYRINIATLIPCLLALVMTLIGVRRSEPKIAPTRSAMAKSMPFVQGLKRLFRSRAFLWLFLSLGGGIGMFNSLYTIMQQVLCPKGYSNQFSGLCSALMIVSGVFGSVTSGVLVDRTKMFEEIMKISFSFAALSGAGYAVATQYPDIPVVIGFACCCFGFFGLAAYPLGMEMTAECTHPVAETTSTGLVVLSGQIQGVLYILLMQSASNPIAFGDVWRETCTAGRILPDGTIERTWSVEAKDMLVPLMIFASIGVTLIVLFVIFFKPKYRRLRLEAEGKRKENAENTTELQEKNGGNEIELKYSPHRSDSDTECLAVQT